MLSLAGICDMQRLYSKGVTSSRYLRPDHAGHVHLHTTLAQVLQRIVEELRAVLRVVREEARILLGVLVVVRGAQQARRPLGVRLLVLIILPLPLASAKKYG